jgi:hypothetical protein
VNSITFDLPDDALKFLRAGRQLAYNASQIEAGVVKLKHLDELKLGEVWIAPKMPTDPHRGENGYYAVPAVSLTGECANYDPEFILLWLPGERLFGTWDNDHWVLKVFLGASWADIVTLPAAYINAQWDAMDRLGSTFVPWPKYEFKMGRPF